MAQCIMSFRHLSQFKKRLGEVVMCFGQIRAKLNGFGERRNRFGLFARAGKYIAEIQVMGGNRRLKRGGTRQKTNRTWHIPRLVGDDAEQLDRGNIVWISSKKL